MPLHLFVSDHQKTDCGVFSIGVSVLVVVAERFAAMVGAVPGTFTARQALRYGNVVSSFG